MDIICSKKIDKYYAGACIDIDRRLYEHNIGHSKFSSTGIPWQLCYTEEEEFEGLSDAKEGNYIFKNKNQENLSKA